jgi:hypothetical protein
VQLAGAGETSCTNQATPSANGDRWCAFRRPGTAPKSTELWVVNVSKAIAGSPAPCDGTSADCLRLTETLWTEEPILGPRQWLAHRFDGDTLLFHADALSAPDQPYTGPIYAWRPGWTKARRLASKAYACYGHATLPLALCVDDVAYEGAVPLEFDLRAGDLSDPNGDSLPVIERARYSRADRQQGPRLGFSDDGQYLIYTSARTADSPTPDLRLVRMAVAPPQPMDLLPDAVQWELSVDQTKIFFLSGFKDDKGTLAVADFPSGANVRTGGRTDRYLVLGDHEGHDLGVGFFVEGEGRFLSEYRAIPDRDAFSDSVLVFRYSRPLEDFHLSRNGRYTGFAMADFTEGFNGYLVHSDGTGRCILNSEQGRPAFEYYFLDSDGLVFWAEESPDSSDYQDGWFGRPEGCKDKRLFAQHLAFSIPIHDDGLLFGENLQLQNDTFTLAYAAIAHGTDWPAGGAARIHDRVAYPVSLLAPSLTHVVFAVIADNEQDSGLFVFGPLPFIDSRRDPP